MFAIEQTDWRSGFRYGDFSIEQVVRDYGDLCQVITELTLEHEASITSHDFGILTFTMPAEKRPE